MPRQLKLKLVAADCERIVAAADIQSALAEMLRAYFDHILSEEEHTGDDGKDHREP